MNSLFGYIYIFRFFLKNSHQLLLLLLVLEVLTDCLLGIDCKFLGKRRGALIGDISKLKLTVSCIISYGQPLFALYMVELYQSLLYWLKYMYKI